MQNLFEKYVPYLIDMIVEGIVDGRQGEKLKTIVPQTDLNMVRNDPRSNETFFPKTPRSGLSGEAEVLGRGTVALQVWQERTLAACGGVGVYVLTRRFPVNRSPS